MNSNAFTLIEIMAVVAVVGILGAIVIPKYADMTRKAQEAATKGNLASIRSALAIYYGETEGTFPSDASALTTRWLGGIPMAYYPTHHNPGNSIGSGDSEAFRSSFTEDAYWWYFTDDPGHIVANCIHEDARQTVWTTY